MACKIAAPQDIAGPASDAEQPHYVYDIARAVSDAAPTHYDYNIARAVSDAAPTRYDYNIERAVSDETPTHYTVKIQSFSILTKHAIEMYESGEFQAGGYKWKLVLYPNGKKSKNVKEHISVYLEMADRKSLPPGWEVYAVVRFFLLDQNRDKYLIVEDSMERRFHRLKHQWGIDQFISLEEFNDASNGYLVEDTCGLGAEVFVTKERSTGKGECLSMIKDAPTIMHLWKIDNFSEVDGECHSSRIFSAGNQKWKILLYPKGRYHGSGSSVSIYLSLADPTTLSSGSKIRADFTLRVLDQVQARHTVAKGSYWFSASNPEAGWPRYATHNYFYQLGNGCVINDVCLVEAELRVHGISSVL